MSDAAVQPSSRYQSFDAFWPFYLGEHKDPLNRGLHYVGTSLAIGTVAAAALTANPTWLLLTPIVGYAPAWIGHFVVEGNRPATFKYPAWSLRGDLKMLSLALSGRMGDELARLHIVEGNAKAPATDAPSPVAQGDVANREAPAPHTHTNGASASA